VTGRRVDVGGAWIDRSRPIGFTFDGRELTAFEGDTLASALLANGVDVVCRSPILGRLRGIVSAGVEESSAFVEVSKPWFEPIVAATMVNLVDGLVATGRPGVGVLPFDPPPTKPTVHRHAYVEVLVVGSGEGWHPVVEEAVQRGDRVLLVERDRLAAAAGDGVTVLTNATALGLYDDGYAVVHERGPERDTLWHVRAGRVILATGAHERPIAFAHDDRPGVMLAEAVRTYLERFGVLPGKRVVVFTTNASTDGLPELLRQAGAEVAAVADVREGWAVAGTEGDPHVEAVHLVGPEGERRIADADLVAVSGGWNPAAQLSRAIGGGLRYDEALATYVPVDISRSHLLEAARRTSAAYPHLQRAGSGKLVNIGSMMSLFGASFVAPYGASKGGIVQLTRALACAWAKDRIQVNAVLPGWIDTALTRRAREEVAGLHERVLARTPAARWGAPEDLAGIAVFLCSAASDFVTGTAIPVDGGYAVQG